jgi:hypothetical protein
MMRGRPHPQSFPRAAEEGSVVHFAIAKWVLKMAAGIKGE